MQSAQNKPSPSSHQAYTGYQTGYQPADPRVHSSPQAPQPQISNPADLRRDYQRDKEFILKGIKDYINSNDIDAAKDLVDRYRSVANDEVFIKLSKTTDKYYAKNQRINELIEKYNYIPEDQHRDKIKICGEILSLNPNHKQFKANMIHELECIYQKLDDTDIARRLTVCTELARLDSHRYSREKNRLEKKYKKSLEQARKQVPAVQKATSLNIGSAVWSHPALSGKYASAYNNFEVPIKEGHVTLKIHTHGISISPGYAGPVKLHYTCIHSIDFVPPSGIASALAGAAVGGVLGGIVGAIGGALLGSNASPAIRIGYHDPQKDSNKVVLIHTESANQAKTFIANYMKEVEITKRTGRKASALKSFVTGFIKVLLILLAIAAVIALFFAFILLVLPTAS